MMNDSDQLEEQMDNVVFDLKLELAGLVLTLRSEI